MPTREQAEAKKLKHVLKELAEHLELRGSDFYYYGWVGDYEGIPLSYVTLMGKGCNIEVSVTRCMQDVEFNVYDMETPTILEDVRRFISVVHPPGVEPGRSLKSTGS